MLLAGLTGFLNADAEDMKTKAAATRAANAEAIKETKGFKRQIALDIIKNRSSNISEILKAVAKGDATMSTELSNQINDYRAWEQDLAKTGNINTPAPYVNFAAIDYVNSDYNTIFKDASGKKVRFKADLRKGDINGYRSFMSELNSNYLAAKRSTGPDGKAGNYFKGISDENLAKMYSEYLTGLSFVRSAERKDQGEGFTGTNFLPDNEFTDNLPTPFYGGTALANELISRGQKTKQQIEKEVNATILNTEKKIEGETITAGTVKLPNNKISAKTFTIPKEYSNAADTLATAMDTTKGDLYNEFANKFYNLPGVSAEKVQQVFTASLYFAQNIPNIGQLSPSKAVSYGTAENIEKMNQVINDSNLSFTEVVFAIAPYMDVSKHIAEKLPRGQTIGMIKKPVDESTQSYAGKKFAGRTADKKDREKAFLEAKKNFMAQEAVQIALGKFLQERMTLSEAEGKGVRTEIVASFISKLRALKEVALDFGSAVFENNNLRIDTGKLEVTSGANDDNTAENDKTLTQGYLNELKNRAIRDAIAYSGGNQLDEKVARLQAMRITLAFQMARAADPSGRLSNQDIEQQFVKLAGNFGTEKAALSGIQVAIDEFKTKAEENKLIFDFVKDGDASRVETFKTIDALFVVNDIQRKAKSNRLLGATKPSAMKSTTGIDLTQKKPDGSDLYVDMGTHAIETQNYNAVNKQTGKIIPPEELKSFIESKGSETATP